MSICGKCIHYEICDEYVSPCETFPETDGCPCYKSKEDVVEVVRCSECIFARLEDGKIKCYHTYGLLVSKETDYCSRGKRRAEE